MPITLHGETYYRTREVAQTVGISRLTLLRWLSSGIIQGIPRRDRRGWRLFTQAEIGRIKDEVNKIQCEPVGG
jgi:predicted site-specific integrase-resolvase